MKTATLFVILLIVSFFLPQGKMYAQRKKKKASIVTTTQSQESAYKRFFRGKKCETVKGMFSIHKMDGKVYFEIPFKLLNKDMLLGSTITETTNNDFGSVGEKPHDPLHVTFIRRDSIICLCLVNEPYSTNEARIAQRIEESSRPAVLKNFPIKVYSEDYSAVVIDVTDYFLSGDEKIDPFSPYAPLLGGDRRLIKKFDRSNSLIGKVKAFPDNITVQSFLSYTVNIQDKNYYYAYNLPFTALMTRSLILLPEKPMYPRQADPRIGIFFQGLTEFNSMRRGVEYKYYAQRWRLEPKDEEAFRLGKLVEPKKPIVFYVDNTFPASWNKPIKEAVETWQIAFEQIGFKNAIIAKDFPVDDPEFDPDNLKYSCIRYSPSLTANAMGPAWTDPRSGEIINASVYCYHNLVKMAQAWRFVQTAAVDPDVRSLVLKKDLFEDCIRYVVAHEIGHCLGLMHNMSASAAIPVDSLRSPSFTQKNGTTYSIMDYARFNYVAQPGDKELGVKLTPPKVGLYDLYAIKWLYTPIYQVDTPEQEIAILNNWISEKAGNPIYRYGKQQFYGKRDPSSQEEDLGDDAVKASTYGIKNLKYIVENLHSWIGPEDRDFSFRQDIYNELIQQYFRYLNHVFFNIGGIYINEVYDGDPLPVYQSVPRHKQKEALNFLLRELKNLTWLNDPNLLRGLPLSNGMTQVIEDRIFSALLKRSGYVSLSASKATQEKYTQEEYLNDIFNFVWTPTRNGKKLTAFERKIQIAYLAYLIGNSDTGEKMSGKLLGCYSGDMIELPTCIQEKKRYYESQLNRAKQKCVSSKERAGFDMNVYVAVPNEPMKHIHFDLLKQVRNILNSRLNTGDDNTQKHYRLLKYKVDKALNVL